jgi:hypothetical protein
LVLGAGSRLTARADLPAIRDVPAQLFVVLVVDDLDPVNAEVAHARATISTPAAASPAAASAIRAPSTVVTLIPTGPALVLFSLSLVVGLGVLCIVQVGTPHYLENIVLGCGPLKAILSF